MKIKLTTLTPLHIGDGEEYDYGFNLFYKDNKVYIFDEFRALEGLIKLFPNVHYESAIKNQRNIDYLINNKFFKREIDSNFTFKDKKPLLSHISVNDKPYIPGSSLKGAIETALLNCIFNINNSDNENRCGYIYERFKNKHLDRKRINNTLDDDFVELFKNFIVRDSISENVKTRVYKTYNMKKERNHQINRKNKVKEIANYVECIEPNQEFEIEIIDKKGYFKNIGRICNKFYIDKLKKDIKYYFYKKKSWDVSKIDGLGNNKFILQLGRFTGCESKSVDNLRICDKTAVTFASSENVDKDLPLCEKKLIPFGWVVCEILDKGN